MKKLKLAVIGTTGLPAKYGGFETLAHHLVDHLNQDHEITVYCSSKYFADKNKRLKKFNGANLFYLPFNANGYQSIIYDIVSIIHALRYANALLILGVSGTILLPIIKIFSSKPMIVNIDGQEWKRPKWNWITRKFLKLCERIAVRYANTIITDNRAIQDYVSQEYNTKSVLIEYGADHVSKQKITDMDMAKYPFLAAPYAFNVCRIEPENNIHLILEAFVKQPFWNLVIVGLWNHGTYGMALKAKYSIYSNIHLLDPIYNQDELNVLRSNTDLYVHGHSAGGTNPSLVEAMYLGLPIMTFDVSYNRETTSHKALYFRTPDELIYLLNTTGKSKLEEVGNVMHEVACTRYIWQNIAQRYHNEIMKLCKQPVFKTTTTIYSDLEKELAA